jgi:Fe-S oxidoreductase
MAKLKAEFLQQYYDANGVPFRSWLIANFSASAKLGMVFPRLYNFLVSNHATGSIIKKLAGFNIKRSMPHLGKTTLRAWYLQHKRASTAHHQRKVYLFCDEFSNYNDVEIGRKTILLLEKLGYEVVIPEHEESGRTWLSKGLVRKAKKIINKNIQLLSPLISAETPLLGIEPSAILTFRDEYPDLATATNLPAAKALAKQVFMVDEFLAKEMKKGLISKSAFTEQSMHIQLHGHCQQKALVGVSATTQVLSFPMNYTVETIPSGCCGMAGSFGFEKEHYHLSMEIGELVLFPAVRAKLAGTITAAPGTSCRHQIKDGTDIQAKHPVEILFAALK